MLEDRLDDVGVVVDAELVGHSEEERIGFGDGLVFLQLFDEHVRLRGIAAAEHGAPVVTEEADRVRALAVAAEIGAVAIVHQREDAAADRHPGLRAYVRPPSRPRGICGSGRPAG